MTDTENSAAEPHDEPVDEHGPTVTLIDAGAVLVDRLSWHLFLSGYDLTDPPTVTSAYRYWNCPRSGVRRRASYRAMAATILAAAVTEPTFPIPISDGEEIGTRATGEVVYRRNRQQGGLTT